MKAWPRIDEVRSSGWSGAEEEIEPEPLSVDARAEDS